MTMKEMNKKYEEERNNAMPNIKFIKYPCCGNCKYADYAPYGGMYCTNNCYYPVEENQICDNHSFGKK